MPKLTPEGEKIVEGLAEQYKIGANAVKMMLDAVANGGGGMAQFNVPEFGGNGHWMRGGITMIGDMFNNSMKATVDSLCTELSNLMQAQAKLFAPAAQPQSQGLGSSSGSATAFSSQSWSYSWWPEELGNPSTTGAQNAVRYAYFPEIRRLAIDFSGNVEVYDTTGFAIQGFNQQQAGDLGSLTFLSNRGPVRLNSLPRLHSLSGEARQPPQAKAPEAKGAAQAKRGREAPASEAKSAPEAKAPAEAAQAPKPAAGDANSVLALIEQLSALKEKGVLTEEEFAAQKAELLKRL